MGNSNLPSESQKELSDSDGGFWFWTLAIVVSISIHGLSYWALWNLDQHERERLQLLEDREDHEFILARVMSEKEFQDYLQAQGLRVVDTEWVPQDDSRSDDADPRFLGERTQRVQHETQKRGSPRGGNSAGGNSGASDSAESPERMSKEEKVKLERLRRLGLGLTLTESKNGSQSAESSAEPKGTRDVLRDVPEGDATYLNTNEYVFASFYNRLKSDIGARWEVLVRQYLNDRQRVLPHGFYLTQTEFEFDADGRFLRARVLNGSGARGLDRCAIEAIESTVRVPNPPAALVKNGRIEVKLGFVVELGKNAFQFRYVPDPRYQNSRGQGHE